MQIMILLSLAKAFLLYIAAAAFIQIDQSIYSQSLHSKIAPSRAHLLVEKRTILASWLSSYSIYE
jgi:hypothetical protein